MSYVPQFGLKKIYIYFIIVQYLCSRRLCYIRSRLSLYITLLNSNFTKGTVKVICYITLFYSNTFEVPPRIAVVTLHIVSFIFCVLAAIVVGSVHVFVV